MSIRVEGLDELSRSLDTATDEITSVDSLAEAIGTITLLRAEVTAPRLTGKTAAAHQLTTADSRVTVTVGTPYAAYVHARNPWLARAQAATDDQVVAHVEQHITDTVNNIRGA